MADIDRTLSNLRLPPHSIEAEQSLIGGLLLDNSAWDRTADIVAEGDFYRDDHRRIFNHIRKLVESSRPADVVTVYESIEKSNEVEQAGGMAYLGEIANATPSAANIRRYAEIVHERAVLRKLVSVGDEIAANALNPAGRDAKQLLDEAEQKVFEIAEAGARSVQGFEAITPLLGQVVNRIQELYDAHFAECEHLFRSNVNGRRGGIARGANCSLGVHDHVGSARRRSYPRPPARLRALYSRLAGGRRWVTRVQAMKSVVLFFRRDSPLRSTLCA